MEERRIVWLASYPKSGNTWVRLLLGNLLGLSEDEDEEGFAAVAGISSSRGLFDFTVGLNSFELTDEEIDRLRPAMYRRLAAEYDDIAFIKAHDAFGRLPDGEPFFPADCSRAAIYIVRDPLDVAISYAHHQGEQTFDKTVDGMNDPSKSIAGGNREQLRQVMFDWSGHYRSWTDQGEIPVCVVRYEDLRADTAGELARIIDFIGVEESRFASSIEQAVEASRFERLQEMESAKGFKERPDKAERFFRSGRSGEGRMVLPEYLQKALIARHGDVMRELGYLQGKFE